ncbi:hypothetical protein GWI33_013280 [Rhynchophorus ferrugineus]|uniref:Uncharacterized protein n=1 Tax=Rhynchophorus ferrugineus TaxID=354439 RepID=A0A834MBQ5_RHYFE|nr:hypothetical protein GWI33_013280 [Rhynchophorus ferrugineus]
MYLREHFKFGSKIVGREIKSSNYYAQGVTAYVPNHGWDIPAVPITQQVQRMGVSMTNGFTDNLGVRRVDPMNENHKYVLAYQPIICPTPPQRSREYTMNITNDSYPVNIGEKLNMNDQCSSSQGNIILKNKQSQYEAQVITIFYIVAKHM